MIVFAVANEGGVGQTVTCANLAFQRAGQGDQVCYLDFDFDSPVAGAVLAGDPLVRGSAAGGLHAYLRGNVLPEPVEVWRDDPDRGRHGRLSLLPGSQARGEFRIYREVIDRCVDLLVEMEARYDVTIVDLSAGRSFALDLALSATAHQALRNVRSRWLVFYRWSPLQVVTASELVDGPRGIIDLGDDRGHDRERLARSIGFVRTHSRGIGNAGTAGLSSEQLVWLARYEQSVESLAAQRGVLARECGAIPFDLVLGHEQVVTGADPVTAAAVGPATMAAFRSLAAAL